MTTLGGTWSILAIFVVFLVFLERNHYRQFPKKLCTPMVTAKASTVRWCAVQFAESIYFISLFSFLP